MSAATTDTRFCLVDNGDELTLKTKIISTTIR